MFISYDRISLDTLVSFQQHSLCPRYACSMGFNTQLNIGVIRCHPEMVTWE